MNLAVFASGRGSNFQAILRAIDDGRLSARVTLVLSNRSDAGALEIARARGIPAVHCSRKSFGSDSEFVTGMLAHLTDHRCDAIALAGYMKHVPAEVVAAYRNRITNIHPALLPAFGGAGMYGHHVHEAVYASGAKFSGATVHLVDEEYDRGPILLQEAVALDAEDTPDSIAAKVLAVEHRIYPIALQALAEGRIDIQGQRAWIRL
jgi:phosphoribosylglycinamide formyltransferase-1